MRLSQKGEYGLLALLELARLYGQGPIQASAIAEKRRIPAQYLPQILLRLRHAGLVRSERGPRGGHELAQPPAEITLASAVVALEGSASPAACVDADREPGCPERGTCVLQEVWRRIDAATQAILQEVTLADLARREEERQAAPMYHI